MKWGEFVADLSDEQIKGVSEIARDIGQICVGSVVIPLFIPEFAPDRIVGILAGSIGALAFWYLSITILKRIPHHE